MASKRAINPAQLRMFMSADEIVSHYQPNEGDRDTSGQSWREASFGIADQPRSAWSTASARSTHEAEPDIRVYKATYMTHTRGGGVGARTGGGTLYRQRPGYEAPESMPETDEEVWRRKADEAWDTGHAQHMMEHGVEQPVHLGTQFGSSGKPIVAGGHHRIGFMLEESPHELMPVIHHQGGVGAAKDEGKSALRARHLKIPSGHQEGGYPYH